MDHLLSREFTPIFDGDQLPTVFWLRVRAVPYQLTRVY